MCIIAYKPSNMPMFELGTLAQMFRRNPNGAGLMFTDNNKVIIKKGFMTFQDLYDYLEENKNLLNKKNVVLHFRITTSGSSSKLNTHPYPLYLKNKVDMTCDLAVAHNGVLHNYSPPFNNKEDLNDSQIFIRDILNELPKGFLSNKAIKKLISNEIGNSKLAFIDKKGKVTLIGNFIEDGGYYFSNTSYKTTTFTTRTTRMSYPYVVDSCCSSSDHNYDELTLFNDWDVEDREPDIKFINGVFTPNSEAEWDEALSELSVCCEEVARDEFVKGDDIYIIDEFTSEIIKSNKYNH